MKRISLTLIAGLLSIAFFASTVSAQYGGGNFGVCAYGQACPVPSVPVPPPPVVQQPPAAVPNGTPTPDVSTDPVKVVSDVDKDGNLEEARDTDGNLENGYEEYYDPDGSSTAVLVINASNGNKFIIDNDGDDRPDVYWDPTSEYTTSVAVLSDNTGVGWFYRDSDGEARVHYVQRFERDTNGPTGAGIAAGSDGDSGERRLTGDNFGGETYRQIGELIVKVPTPVAYGFPYLLLGIVGILIIRLILQTRQELTRVSAVVERIRKEKELNSEKQNFLMLSSHYMRTPMTVIKGNIELLQSLKTLNDEGAAKLQAIIVPLQQKIEALLSQLSNDQGLAAIQAPVQKESVATKKILFSPQVLLPVLFVVVIGAIAQFIFVDFQVTKPNVIDFLVQIGLVVLLVQILVSKIRSHIIHAQNRQEQDDLLEKQRQLDRARSELVDAAATKLREDVVKLEDSLQAFTLQGTDISRVRKGSDQLKAVINKFVFAAGLEAGQVSAEKEQFNSSEIIANSMQAMQEAAQKKNLSLQTTGSELMLIQNKPLMNIVLSSLVDNAVKFSQEGTTVTVASEATPDKFVFTVDNQGKEIDQTKVDHLFKPFSRLESAETFDQEGLGFSLYLDRLIMMYLGGEVGVQPIPGQGTKAYVTVPVLA